TVPIAEPPHNVRPLPRTARDHLGRMPAPAPLVRSRTWSDGPGPQRGRESGGAWPAPAGEEIGDTRTREPDSRSPVREPNTANAGQQLFPWLRGPIAVPWAVIDRGACISLSSVIPRPLEGCGRQPRERDPSASLQPSLVARSCAS